MELNEATVQALDGWLSPKEGRLLFHLARNCKGRGAIVEIGSWKGKSTIWLAHGSGASSQTKVHAIDPHTGSPEHAETFGQVWTFEEFKRNIANANVQRLVVPHVDFSTAVARAFDEPVELIFVDGLHEYEGVRDDFDAWFPKVLDGGTMAFHDSTSWPGVFKVVTDSVFKSRHFRKIRFAGSIVYGQKVAQNRLSERCGNRAMWWVFRVYAFTERWKWRLIHDYLDFPITRAIVRYLKKRRLARMLLITRTGT
jgi:MMP 1-O-methyltransferase